MTTGAQALIESLKREQVAHIFGYAGATICPAVDALKSHPEIRLHPGPHGAERGPYGLRLCPDQREGGGVHGDLRPGRHQPDHRHRHRLYGLHPHGGHHRPGTQQSAGAGYLPGGGYHRRGGPASPSTATWSRTPTSIPRIVKEAFHIASTGRPGPVLIDIPIDVQEQVPEKVRTTQRRSDIRGYKPSVKGNDLADQAGGGGHLAAAKQPVICAGGGVWLRRRQRGSCWSLAERCSRFPCGQAL